VYRKFAIASATLIAVATTSPETVSAQRFGGQFGGGAAFWVVYVDPGVSASESFDRDLGQVVGLGSRAFFQTGRFRLGGGFFAGGFTDEGPNEVGNIVSGGLSTGGVIAEYLVVQQNFEVAVGGLAGGGSLTVEESLLTENGVEALLRRSTSFFAGYPWVRAGYNLAPFVNVGLEVGYFIGTNDVGGFAAGFDIVVGLIP
jgi:hypothetical protein